MALVMASAVVPYFRLEHDDQRDEADAQEVPDQPVDGVQVEHVR